MKVLPIGMRGLFLVVLTEWHQKGWKTISYQNFLHKWSFIIFQSVNCELSGVPRISYVEIVTPSTLECALIRKQGLRDVVKLPGGQWLPLYKKNLDSQTQIEG